METERIERIIRTLRDAGRTLAVAESFTGGLVMETITRVPGASDVLVGGVVAYSNQSKTLHLHVEPAILEQHGAVSGDVAAAMADGVRRAWRADYGVSTTGIAGPGGATPAKPVGLSFVAVSAQGGTVADRAVHSGSRAEIKAAGVAQALGLLARSLGI